MYTKFNSFITEKYSNVKYRFKTEKELLDEYGEDWHSDTSFNSEGYMDYLLGIDVDVPENSLDHNGNVVKEFIIPNDSGGGGWSIWRIFPEMLVKKSRKPMYRRRKFIYENKQIKTKKGTPIKRYGEVGKKMGNDLYFHKKYVDEYIDEDFYNKLKSELPKDFKFNIIKYNDKNETISFINSPNFDTADEPIVSDSYKVTKEGKVTHTKEKNPPMIYHHKWLFVKDDYNGFNVEKSKERSLEWLTVSDRINMSKIGSKRYWEEEVLPLLEEKSVWDKPKQEFPSAKTSIRQVPKPAKRLIENEELKEGTVNLDIGGGKYDEMTDYFKEHGITNYVYDPFNRSPEHNKKVIEATKNGQVDTVTIFNVLNVIKEPQNQLQVLRQAKNALKKGGKVYVYSNYHVKGEKPREIKGRDSFQQFYKLKDTLPIIKKIFPNAELVSKLLCVIGTK